MRSVWLGLGVAICSAAALNWGYFVQHGAAASAPDVSLRRPVASLASLLRAPGWLASNGIVFAGWLLYLLALKIAPLSLVQAASAGGIGILAVLVARFGETQLSRREWSSVALAIAGLALLGASLGGRTVVERAGSTRSIAIWLAVSIAVAALAAGPASRSLSAGAGLGIAAGLLFASADVATKASLTGDHRWYFIPAFLGVYAIGFVALQIGFQRGGALATAGLASLCMNALPIAAGVALFHNGIPGGGAGVLRLSSFVAVIGGAALLARPEERTVEEADGPVRIH